MDVLVISNTMALWYCGMGWPIQSISRDVRMCGGGEDVVLFCVYGLKVLLLLFTKVKIINYKKDSLKKNYDQEGVSVSEFAVVAQVTPYTLHLTPYTLHFTPYTLYLTHDMFVFFLN